MLSKICIVLALAGIVFCQSDNTCQSKDTQSAFFPKVSESAEKGDVIFKMTFYGIDDEMDLRAFYNEYFAFDPVTHNVFVNATLDAESRPGTQNLEVICKVKASGQEIKHTVYIRITDANDNVPKFTSDVYNITIGEMTPINWRISSDIEASDDDATPSFNSIYYRIIEGPYSDYFALESFLKPNLVLAKDLDYETLRTFSFTLMAQDYYPGENPDVKFNATCVVVVTVEDEDDQYPVFNSSIYRGFITIASAVDSTIDIQPPISAYDPDASLNARVEYSFHGDIYVSSRAQALSSVEADVGLQLSSDAAGQVGHYFDIDSETGEVTLVKRPTSNEIYLLLQATQEDNPSRYGVALLTVQLQGSNVNAPVFTKNSYDVATLEGFPPGEVIGSVLALDKDTGSKITYRLANDSDVFRVDSSSGDVTLVQSLSSAASPMHRVFIEASDGDLTAVTSLMVRVLKSNHHPPTVTNSNLTVSAKPEKGHIVIDIKAQDPDGLNSLSYSILNYKQIFHIDNDGVVEIIADSKDITEDVYEVSVLISDNGQPSLDTVVVIRVHFPKVIIPPVAAASTGQSDDMIAMVLGAVVAVLFIILLVLIVYLLRNRLKDKEHLDRVKKQHPSRDPRALAFKQKSFGRKAGNRLDHIEFREDKLDGATTIQENPLSAGSKGSYFNFGQMNSDPDGDLDIYNNDIQVETSVVPFDHRYSNDDNNNDHIYNNSQLSVDSEDADNIDKNAFAAFYRNATLNAYPDSSGSDMSLNTSPTESHDSKKGLVSSSHSPEGNGVFWVNNAADISDHIEMDPDSSVQPSAQKQELTVYF